MFIKIITTALIGIISFLGITKNTSNLGGFSDPFLSIQLATSPVSSYCLKTDGTNNSWSASCGSGSGIATSTNPLMATYFVATSTTVASTFPLASTTLISSTGNAYFGTNGGFVGIGTTTPSTLLNLYGSAPIIKIANSNSGNIAGLNIDYLGINKAVFTANMATGEVKIGGSVNGYFPTFYSHGSEAMRIDTSSDVGIGSTSPYAKLSVTNTGTDPSFIVEDSTSPDTTPFIIDAAGLVGIGTSSLTYTLNVQGTSNLVGTTYFHPTDAPTNTSRGVNITPGSSGSSHAINAWANSGSGLQLNGWSTGSGVNTAQIFINPSTSGTLPYIDFLTGTASASSRMRILDTGFVGIGTTSPGQKLSVAGDILGNNIIGSYFTATSSTATSTFAGSVSVGGNILITGNDKYISLRNNAINILDISGNTRYESNGDVDIRFDKDNSGTAGDAFSIQDGSGAAYISVDNSGNTSVFKSGGTGTYFDYATGNVGIGTTNPSQKLEVNGGMRLNTATAKPTCDSTVRGTFWFTQSGAGVKDAVEVCAKDAADAYAWRTIY